MSEIMLSKSLTWRPLCQRMSTSTTTSHPRHYLRSFRTCSRRLQSSKQEVPKTLGRHPRSITAPLAAFTMALLLGSYCISSIRAARRETQYHLSSTSSTSSDASGSASRSTVTSTMWIAKALEDQREEQRENEKHSRK